ncbi:hypothetical protein SAMN05192565_107126 [Methylobacterium gossipiicola]|uniref:Uncharacterized protein n=1 Tax=Methylobacterium gossipiicola TaxID=582675 RepID=A0A1I2TKH9_9HYPH|nr:hypothetical protein SAMN05192565_107126 [Methylobacterium gossipiicola]
MPLHWAVFWLKVTRDHSPDLKHQLPHLLDEVRITDPEYFLGERKSTLPQSLPRFCI